MKKSLICTMTLAAMLFSAATSYAATYDSEGDKVTTASAANKKAVIIVKGGTDTVPTGDNIVYVNQANSAFDATTEFLIKNSDADMDGLYTVMLGGDNAVPVKEIFRIGMSEDAGDLRMTLIEGDTGFSTNADGSKNYGYKATAESGTAYQSVIVKCNGSYLGKSIPNMTNDGEVGIQINGVQSTDTIEGVWLSTRNISGGTVTAATSNN